MAKILDWLRLSDRVDMNVLGSSFRERLPFGVLLIRVALIRVPKLT
jgi:hypothetical protein